MSSEAALKFLPFNAAASAGSAGVLGQAAIYQTTKSLTTAPRIPKVRPAKEIPAGQIAGAAAAVRKRTLEALASRGARGGTIRTSGLGLLGEPYLANKTLLGA